MEKIIVKKIEKKYAKEGLGKIKPIFFYIDEKKEFIPINRTDFPNTGDIFVTDGYDKFDANLYYEIPKDRLTSNYDYEKNLEEYQNGTNNKNPSKFVLNYYKANSIPLAFSTFLPIFEEKFDVKKKRLIAPENILFEPFFLFENKDTIIGPFGKDGNDGLKPFRFQEYEDIYEGNDEYLDFSENTYSDYDGEFIFRIKRDEVENFIVKDAENNYYLTDFQSFIKNAIGVPIYYSSVVTLRDWVNKQLKVKLPDISKINEEIYNFIDKTNKVDVL